MSRSKTSSLASLDTVPRPRRRWRTVARIAAVVALIGGITALATRTTSPIGYWRSADDQTAFLAVYDTAMAELPSPSRTLDIRTEYGIVRVYRFEGTGNRAEPLVLLPGRASATPVWEANLRTLLEIGDVYTIDLLGEPGMSVQSRPIVTNDDHAEWLHHVLEALPEPNVHVLGLSIGGWTAANLVTRQPDHVASLTLIDPAVVFADLPLEVVVRSIPASVPWLPKSWRDGFNSWTAGGAPVDDEPVADMIESGMQGYALALSAPTRISHDALSALDLPVLVVLAEQSVMHDAESAATVAETFLARGTVLVVPGASHAINGEHPDLIARELGAFLEALD